MKKKAAEDFLKKLPQLEEYVFDSVGMGKDHRYEGGSIIGTALVVDKTPVHASFFMSDEDKPGKREGGRSTSLSRRMRAMRKRRRSEDA